MNFKTELFLAWKYFKPKRSAVSVITLISVIGVGLGVAVLIVVLAVMTGFADQLKQKLLETGSHAGIMKYGADYFSGRELIYDPEPVIEIVNELGGDAEPIVMSPVLLLKDDRFLAKLMIGINPEDKSERINLKKNLKIPHPDSFSLKHGEVVVGHRVASELGANIQDNLLILSSKHFTGLFEKDDSGKFRAIEKKDVDLPDEYKISGFFSFGKYDFDNEVIFMNLDDADEVLGYPWGAATEIYVWTDDAYNIEPFIKKLEKAFAERGMTGYRVYSWKDKNAQFLSVLQVEKNMQFFLLFFIVLVAAFSITNTLITTVIQKTKEIGLLKAMGATSAMVMRVFIMQGLFVGLLGTSFGIILGCTVIKYRTNILMALRHITGQEIFPAQVYIFDELPAHLIPSDIVVISIISIVLCTMGAVIPAFRAAKLDPARALRYE